MLSSHNLPTTESDTSPYELTLFGRPTRLTSPVAASSLNVHRQPPQMTRLRSKPTGTITPEPFGSLINCARYCCPLCSKNLAGTAADSTRVDAGPGGFPRIGPGIANVGGVTLAPVINGAGRGAGGV